jgi:hypothetical protein
MNLKFDKQNLIITHYLLIQSKPIGRQVNDNK